jgi:spermidine/putrescine transport system substrate-binding protein
VLLLLASCDSAPLTPDNTPAAVSAVSDTPAAPPPSPAAGGILRILNRQDHIDPDLYEAFTQLTGIEIQETTYDDDDELLATVQPANAFDLVVASDHALTMLRNGNRLSRLDQSALHNWSAVDLRLKNLASDPGSQFSAPYVWGTIGILYRTDLNPGPVDSWKSVFTVSAKASTVKSAMLDDPRMGVGAALKVLGYSLNSRNSSELAKARALLLAHKGPAVRIDAGAWSDALLTGDVSLAQASSDDAAFTQSSNVRLRYAIPREGSPLWVDSLAVPANSTRLAAAHQFIDFTLRPDMSARIAAYTYSLPPVPEAYNRMDPQLAALFRGGYLPDDSTFSRLELVADAGPAKTRYDQIWIDLKK